MADRKKRSEPDTSRNGAPDAEEKSTDTSRPRGSYTPPQNRIRSGFDGIAQRLSEWRRAAAERSWDAANPAVPALASVAVGALVLGAFRARAARRRGVVAGRLLSEGVQYSELLMERRLRESNPIAATALGALATVAAAAARGAIARGLPGAARSVRALQAQSARRGY